MLNVMVTKTTALHSTRRKLSHFYQVRLVREVHKVCEICNVVCRSKILNARVSIVDKLNKLQSKTEIDSTLFNDKHKNHELQVLSVMLKKTNEIKKKKRKANVS